MEIIHKYFPNLSRKQIQQFALLQKLYTDWNEKINIISRKDISHLYERHILHSLGIAKFFPLDHSLKILDVGTGGGFPGIPLAILFPEADFTLVDSVGKKIKVVKDVIQKTELENCRAIHQRAEKIKGQFDFIVSRAVTRFDNFVSIFNSKIKPGIKTGFPNGILYLKGGEFDEELKNFKKNSEVYPLSQVFEEEFFETKKIIYLKIYHSY
ncbi:MAG: 16S rRNA (guanine(527)-N(7))-methyltransferase RsmG [Bacteroidota bacterium]